MIKFTQYTVLHEEANMRLKQLARMGLVDKKEYSRMISAMKKINQDKQLSVQERGVVVGMVNKLVDIITGDTAVFQKAKKAVSENLELFERAMSDSEKKKKEDIVMAMKKDAAGMKDRYGDRWKDVMYATATKKAMGEEVGLDEAIMQGSKEHLKKLQNMLDKVKPGSADHSQIRGAIESKFGKKHIPAKHRNVKPNMYEEIELDEISLEDLTKKVAASNHLKKVKKAYKADDIKKSIDAMKKRLNVEHRIEMMPRTETVEVPEGKTPGLWDNIHAKRKRIKSGSGEKMRKPGSKGAPTDQAFVKAAEQVELDEISKEKAYKYWHKSYEDETERRSDIINRKSPVTPDEMRKIKNRSKGRKLATARVLGKDGMEKAKAARARGKAGKKDKAIGSAVFKAFRQDRKKAKAEEK